MPRRSVLISVILVVAILVIYWPVCHFGFVNFDDYDYITTNPHVTQGLTWNNFCWAFTTFYNTNYHPLTWISLQLDVSLFGVNPHAMHFENVVLHAACTLLLFRAMFLATAEFWISAFICAVFAVHPTHVESVAWITERKDVLSTFFLLLAFLCYLKIPSYPYRAYCGLVVCYALGLLAKSMLVTFPFLLLLLDFWPLGRRLIFPLRRLVIWKIPLFILAIFSSFMTFRSQQSIIAPLHAIPAFLRFENSLLAYAGYLQKEFWPTNLCVLYPYRSHISLFAFSGALALLILITAFFARGWRTRPYFIVGWLWFLGTLVPVIGIVQVGAQAMADRYLYFPSIGLTIIAAYAARDFLKPAFSACIAVIILVMLTTLSHRQVKYWRDGYTLFEHASVVLNGNEITEVRLGQLSLHRGDLADAQHHYENALRLDPGNFAAELDLGNLYLKSNPQLAAQHFQRAALDDPTAESAQLNWGVALLRLKNPAEAFEHFKIAESLDPAAYDPHYNLGQMYLSANQLSQARAEFLLALQARPGDPQASEGLQAAHLEHQK